MAAVLEAGVTYRVRYKTRNMESTQDTRERRVKVLRGPHDDARFQDGQVVSVSDLGTIDTNILCILTHL